MKNLEDAKKESLGIFPMVVNGILKDTQYLLESPTGFPGSDRIDLGCNPLKRYRFYPESELDVYCWYCNTGRLSV